MWPEKKGPEEEVEIREYSNIDTMKDSFQGVTSSNLDETNKISPTGQDLIDAAKECDSEKVYNIIKQGVSPNVVDQFGKAPIHYVVSLQCQCCTCAENAENCLLVLLQFPETDLDIQDSQGLTALHIAAENQFEKCVKLLMCKGADVYKYSFSGDQAIRIVAKRAPNVFLLILNFSVLLDGQYPNSEKCVISIDFRPILGQAGDTKKGSVIESPMSRKCRLQSKDNELDLLRCLLRLSKEHRQKILTHPAVSIFLTQKWRLIRKQFWMTSICYILWVLLYTTYILHIYLIKCPSNGRLFNEGREGHKNLTDDNVNTINVTSVLSDGEVKENAGCLTGSDKSATFIVLVVLTVVMTLYEITKIFVTPAWYFRSKLNILHWTLFVLIMVTFIPTFTSQSSIATEQYQLAAVSIFLAWSLILAQIAKFPFVGEYMEIFGHVLNHFLWFLLTHISLFIGFALAFCILFPGNRPYTIFPFAFLKIFVMMVGEMEYQEMFYDSTDGVSGPLVGHLLYVTFVIVVTIILMNLLVGLTVSDIRGLQKEAELSRVSRQIMDMYHLESFLFSKKIPKVVKANIRRMTTIVSEESMNPRIHVNHDTEDHSSSHESTKSNGQPLLPNKYTFKFRPNDPLDKSVPEKLKIAALQLGVQMRNERKEKICAMKKCSRKIFQLFTNEDGQPIVSNF